jgi:tetratricopeptide (TPR) repeat protein
MNLQMKPVAKYSIFSVLCFLILVSIVLGSLFPYARSRKFISGLRDVGNIQTIDDYKANFNRAFDFYAPVGDEELAKFLSADSLSLIQQKDIPEPIARALVDYIEPRLFKDDVRHLLTLGQLHFILWRSYQKNEDFLKAEEYFLKALSIGPKLPPVLFSLIDLYQTSGNQEKLRAVAVKILSLWPDAESVKEFIK